MYTYHVSPLVWQLQPASHPQRVVVVVQVVLHPASDDTRLSIKADICCVLLLLLLLLDRVDG
jgi:hypothetical protein